MTIADIYERTLADQNLLLHAEPEDQDLTSANLKNAVLSQLYTALIVYLLLCYTKVPLQRERYFIELDADLAT